MSRGRGSLIRTGVNPRAVRRISRYSHIEASVRSSQPRAAASERNAASRWRPTPRWCVVRRTTSAERWAARRSAPALGVAGHRAVGAGGDDQPGAGRGAPASGSTASVTVSSTGSPPRPITAGGAKAASAIGVHTRPGPSRSRWTRSKVDVDPVVGEGDQGGDDPVGRRPRRRASRGARTAR